MEENEPDREEAGGRVGCNILFLAIVGLVIALVVGYAAGFFDPILQFYTPPTK